MAIVIKTHHNVNTANYKEDKGYNAVLAVNVHVSKLYINKTSLLNQLQR